MTIPKHNEIRYAALKQLANNQIKKPRELVKPLADYFQLTNAEVEELYPSGNALIFFDRITWAMSFLYTTGYADKPKRGLYQINDAGKQILNRADAKEFLSQAQYLKKAKDSVVENNSYENNNMEQTPLELLTKSFTTIKNEICEDILQTIIKKSPRDFEHLVVKLLEKMGYGGELENASQVTQASNDGGIDGIIKEDILGLGRIHIQAKRYDIGNTVSRAEIQKFVGALVNQSAKGVFITTSDYSPGAIEYANGVPDLVLINGKKLAEYIYDFNLGMQVEQVVEIKKLDSDFWEAMEDG
jgi:restriction system protein